MVLPIKLKKIVENFIKRFTLSGVEASSFKVLNLAKSEHKPGAKVVRTFNKGLEIENLEEFDVVCKFDADIIFPENYLEKSTKFTKKIQMQEWFLVWFTLKRLRELRSVTFVLQPDKKDFTTSQLYDFTNQNEWTFENLVF